MALQRVGLGAHGRYGAMRLCDEGREQLLQTLLKWRRGHVSRIAACPFAPECRKMPVCNTARVQRRFQLVAREMRQTPGVRDTTHVGQQLHLMQIQQIEKNRQRVIRVPDGK
jgi:hypothetical protein